MILARSKYKIGATCMIYGHIDCAVLAGGLILKKRDGIYFLRFSIKLISFNYFVYIAFSNYCFENPV